MAETWPILPKREKKCGFTETLFNVTRQTPEIERGFSINGKNGT